MSSVVSSSFKRLSRRAESTVSPSSPSSSASSSSLPSTKSSLTIDSQTSSYTSPGPCPGSNNNRKCPSPSPEKQCKQQPSLDKTSHHHHNPHHHHHLAHSRLSPLPTYEDLLAIAYSTDRPSDNNKPSPSQRTQRGGGCRDRDTPPLSKPSKSSSLSADPPTCAPKSLVPRKRSRPPTTVSLLPPLPPFIVPLDPHRKGGGKPPLSPSKGLRKSSSPPPTSTTTISYPPSSPSSDASPSRLSSPSRDRQTSCPPPPKPALPLSRPRSPMSPQSPASSLLGLAGSLGLATGTSRWGYTHECKGGLYDEAARMWDTMFIQGWRADVTVCCDDGRVIPAHAAVIGTGSPVLKRKLEEAGCDGCILIPDMPFPAVRAFVRFLYSARYEAEDMQQYVLHLIVLAHAFNVPTLKCACTDEIARPGGKLSVDTAIDMLQLACRFDLPRMRLLCERFVVRHFKEVVHTEGWKVMMDTDPDMERHILEAVVEAEGKQEERRRKCEEDALFQHLFDATQALVHICQDGCRSIRPYDCNRSLGPAHSCRYAACQGVENLLRHFAACQSNMAGGCMLCKRMWQLLELHSRMCEDDAQTCRVILCRHFKEKRGNPESIEETKWRMLVDRVSCCQRGTSSPSGGSSPRPQAPPSTSTITAGVCRSPPAFTPAVQTRDCACSGH